MRSKSKSKKKKFAYRRGEKIAIFLKRGTLVFLIICLIAGVSLGVKFIMSTFRIGEIIVDGNYHLDKEDVIHKTGIKKGKSLVDVDLKDLDKILKKNPWIKKVSLRKQFPSGLVIKVEEAVPKALLSLKKRLYLLDGEGRILERFKGEVTPFLPIIKEINPKNKKAISEAIELVDVLLNKNIVADRESIEIDLESYGLAMKIDGELIKVGYGNYSKKFDRWLELEPEIRKKGLLIKYVDLRFKDSVIVKPRETINGRTAS